MTPRVELALDLALLALDQQQRRITAQNIIAASYARGEADRTTFNVANRSANKAIKEASKSVDFLVFQLGAAHE